MIYPFVWLLCYCVFRSYLGKIINLVVTKPYIAQYTLNQTDADVSTHTLKQSRQEMPFYETRFEKFFEGFGAMFVIITRSICKI